MKKMNPVQQAAFAHEMAAAKSALQAGQAETAQAHLERAHVIGQSHPGPHALTHWWMLKIEWQRRHPTAVAGQAIRMVFGALGSAIGAVPIGNTGGSNISMFKRLPVDPELQAIIDGKAKPEK